VAEPADPNDDGGIEDVQRKLDEKARFAG